MNVARLTIVPAVLALVALGSGSASAASACRRPAGTTVLLSSPQAAIYRRGSQRDATYYACARPNATPRRIASSYQDPYTEEESGQFELAGTFVAWVTTSSDHYGDSGAAVHTIDLRGHHARRVAPVGYGNSNSQMGPLRPITVLRLNLDSTGRTVWLQRTTDIYETTPVDRIVTFDSSDAALELDRASPGHVSHLRLKSGLATWQHDGQQRSARIVSASPR